MIDKKFVIKLIALKTLFKYFLKLGKYQWPFCIWKKFV